MCFAYPTDKPPPPLSLEPLFQAAAFSGINHFAEGRREKQSGPAQVFAWNIDPVKGTAVNE